MAILAFQQPDKVIMLESDDFHGKFEFRPLEPGYGMTIGNSLRRILLSSLEGFAITTIRIEGVEHEFAAIPGVIEDMTEIILNLKQLRFKRQIEEEESEVINFTITGKNVFKAGDINKHLNNFQVINTDIEILGPFTPPIEKINNLYRYNILIKGSYLDNVKKYLSDNIIYTKQNISIDVDPMSII